MDAETDIFDFEVPRRRKVGAKRKNTRFLNRITQKIKGLENVIYTSDDPKKAYKEAQDMLRVLYEASNAGEEVDNRLPHVTLAYKLLMVVTLLLDEMPDLSFFRQEQHMEFYKAYYFLTHAVRKRSIDEFDGVVDVFREKFTDDDTLILIRQIQDQKFAESWT